MAELDKHILDGSNGEAIERLDKIIEELGIELDEDDED